MSISIQAQAAVLFFDTTSRVTYKNIPKWHAEVSRVSPDATLVLVRCSLVNLFFFCCEMSLTHSMAGGGSAGGQQGGRHGSQGEAHANHVPPEEELAVLRHLGQVQLQLREAVPLPRAPAHRVLT
jgi:hypothetical protein